VTFEQLADMPELGSLREFKHPSLAQIRVWQVQGFRNHLVFYRPFQSGIEIIRVLHTARDIPTIFAHED
jgi:toxin ParE1/3/4